MSDESLELIKEFLVESFENLDRLDQELVRLESAPQDKEILNSIFRTIHTIKGTCGFLEFKKLEAIAHVGENLLDSLRSGRKLVNPEITTALLQLVDAIRTILRHIESSQREGDESYEELRKVLVRLNESESSAAVSTKSLDEEFNDILAANEARAAAEAVAAAEAPAVECVSDTSSHLEAPQPTTAVVPAAPEGSSEDAPKSSTVAESSLRVDVGILDSLMNMVGELVLARNQILQFTKTQRDPAFVNTTQRLNLITSELQEGVMRTRMQPIGTVWSKFPRIVRDLARSLQKQVRIEMEGKETDLDKTIIEAIKDPLTHIVRNSIDHGLELPERRRAAGKDPEGCLSLRAFHEGGHVIIEIADDGAGLNVERIRAKAIEKGIISNERAAQMSVNEIQKLIFAPGFSTAEKITNISGRGVGMDVVRSNIERVGGAVDVSSTLGQGTTVKIKIPLTLAIVPALMVSCAGERYAIPQVSLVELVRVEPGQRAQRVEIVRDAWFYRLRGNLLPLVSLDAVLKRPSAGMRRDDSVLNIVVVRVDNHQFGLLVDGVHDTEEIVVKPLGPQLKELTVYAGATILGDGHVALILDVLGISRHAQLGAETDRKSGADVSADGERNARGDKRALLVVQPSPSARCAIPLEQVNRLEEFPAEKIEYTEHGEVIQYRNGILPLLDLGSLLGMPGTPGAVRSVVVFQLGQRLVGFQVERILDIVEESVHLAARGRRAGIQGSLVVQGKVTELIDLSELAQAICDAIDVPAESREQHVV